MPTVIDTELLKKEKLNDNVFKFSFKSEIIANEAKPGQFLEIRITDTVEPFLRRPISIYNAEKETGLVEFIFQVKGKGTSILAERNVGEKISVMGPLGNGTYTLERAKNIAVIGGGIGIFPLYELSKVASKIAKVNTYLGFRSKDFVMLEDEFKSVSSKCIIATDDGSYANSGFAINFLKEDCKIEKPDCIYACGPLPMLRAVKTFAEQENILCQISLEEKMGCRSRCMLRLCC